MNENRILLKRNIYNPHMVGLLKKHRFTSIAISYTITYTRPSERMYVGLWAEANVFFF